MQDETSLKEIANEAEENTKGTEVLGFRIEMDLAPDWSNLVERICRHHGEYTEVALEGDEIVVRKRIKVENKPGMMRDMQNFWNAFVEKRKVEGKWNRI